MLRFVGRRLWTGTLTLAALVTLTFFVMRLAPGGPFSKNRKISQDVLANIQAAYHLDEPVWKQFGRFVWGLAHLDLGPSTRFRDYSVGDIIASGLPYSLTIGTWAILVARLVGIALGIAGALRRNGWSDYAAGTLGVIGIAIPIFVIGPVLQVVFALKLGWLPVGAWNDGWRSLVLPVAVLALPNVAYISRLTRTAMIETIRENYVRTARGHRRAAHAGQPHAEGRALAGRGLSGACDGGDHHRLDPDRDGLRPARHRAAFRRCGAESGLSPGDGDHPALRHAADPVQHPDRCPARLDGPEAAP